jgi:coenzyme F420-0:L-glutamate ligase/coenzyme F420-1:gamma-L-glutamate ligase
VCANAGIDASNTGKKDIVTLLPDDPDQSARDIRARLPALLELPADQAPAIIISDSFGRPWRFGIMDVALGVAGIEPLTDLRDTADADGRVMHSTIVAIADEIASAAELAAGKTSNQPVVLVRGVEFSERGKSEPSVQRDVVMPTEMDLFK